MDGIQKKQMVYRQLGKTAIKISALSFGTMKWISEESCYESIQQGMDAGMNYFDTSTSYSDGMSEKWTARAVKERRSEVYFSSKSHFTLAPSEAEVRKSIEGSLKSTGLDYFDFYQLWGLITMDVLKSALKKGGTLEGIRKAMDEGLIKYGPGFTFHGTPEVFKAAVDSEAFISATVSYNLMNRKEEELIKYAGDKGVGIFIMNPLAGGVLAMAGDSRFDFLKGNGCGTWYGALRFLLANRNITSALVGVSQPDQIGKNMKALEKFDELNEDYRLDLVNGIEKVKLEENRYCTGCKYCEICPNQFSPSKLMQALRDYKIYGMKDKDLKNWIYSKYSNDTRPEVLLQRCVECGKCQENCPQKLEIVDEIRKVKELFI